MKKKKRQMMELSDEENKEEKEEEKDTNNKEDDSNMIKIKKEVQKIDRFIAESVNCTCQFCQYSVGKRS